MKDQHRTFQITNRKISIGTRARGIDNLGTRWYTNFYRNRTTSSLVLSNAKDRRSRTLGGYRGTVDYTLERVARGSDRGLVGDKNNRETFPIDLEIYVES